MVPPLLLLLGCLAGDDLVRHPPPRPVDTGSDSANPDSGEPDSGVPDDTGLPPRTEDPCGFAWDEVFGSKAPHPLPRRPDPPPVPRVERPGVAAIAHAEPAPPGFHTVALPRPGGDPVAPPDSLTMPSYSDDMPLFDRGADWTGATRCFDTPAGPLDLTEEEAWALYRGLAEATTGVALDTSDGHRTVLGLRGTWPGTFWWHGNTPDQFNDTLVLLWRDGDGGHVREFPVNTDTGDYDFGEDASSSLRPNRRYQYEDGWHRSYNALAIDEWGYHVQDDDNANGHWDSDRNGWLPPHDETDHDREGSGHNIHMASVDGPLGEARVQNWSAGCQTIPGMANWEAFITRAWEGSGDRADYFLLDVRDLAPHVWNPCTPDGTHACPFRVDRLPFEATSDTRTDGSSAFDVYNCSDADESGREVVYAFTVDDDVQVTASVEGESGVDVDVHLLEGDDDDACLDRDDTSLSRDLTPGRYVVVVDTYVADGEALAGRFTVRIEAD